MKISKLFHWLYAILMLLPFAFFVPSVLYYAFNDNATMQSVEAPKYETVSVNFNQNIQNGNFENNSNWDVVGGGLQGGSLIAENNILTWTKGTAGTGIIQGNFYKTAEHKYLVHALVCPNTQTQSGILVSGGGTYMTFGYGRSLSPNVWYEFEGIVDSLVSGGGSFYVYGDLQGNQSSGFTCQFANVYCCDLTQMFGSGNEPTLEEFNRIFSNSYYPYTQSELMQITYDTGETQQLVENTDIINYAWESIWDLPLFSWTKVTFVSIPFAYLTGLFGIGANSTLNYVFGYFATISICWLVFDVIMYVPMLVHRWIDKARIE